MTPGARRAVGAVLIAVLLGGTATYLAVRAVRADDHAGPGLDLTRPGTMLYIDGAHRVRQAVATGPDAAQPTGPSCLRAHAAAGTLICLRPAVPSGFEAAVFDRNLVELKTLSVWGTPSRARVSPSGRLVAWTVFHSGDSYLREGEFSTIAGIYDLSTGAHHGSLEDFTAFVDGKPFHPVHVNYWGITFAADDRTFYATMGARERTWLVKGDLVTRRLTAIHENVECPSLSPDGTRIAFKKRVAGRWRLHVLDLAAGRETALAEHLPVDDQPAWLDDGTVVYARPVSGKPALFAVPADGSGSPRLLREAASSPAFPR